MEMLLVLYTTAGVCCQIGTNSGNPDHFYTWS